MTDTRVQGRDVSRWQGDINFDKMYSQGVRFVYCKASQQVADSKFKEFYLQAKDSGLYRGAYHYMDWRINEIDQAKLFVGTMGCDVGELPPMLDFEENPATYGLTREQTVNKISAFLQYVEKATGRVPGIYTGYYFWQVWGTTSATWVKYPFWLAWWAPEWYIYLRTGGGNGAPKPWSKWTFWQYTAKLDGPTNGTQGLSVDGDIFNGSIDELKLFIAGGIIDPTKPPETYVVTSMTLKVFASPSDSSKQVTYPLTFGTEVVVVQFITDARGEKWANLESPVGWCRALYLQKVA